GPGRSSESRAFAVALNEMNKIVYSRTRKSVTWHNSRLVPALDPKAVAAMKEEKGADIIIFGSGSVASQLTQHGLIDEYHLVVSPVILGQGLPLISGVAQRLKVTLQEARPFPSGVVLLRYTAAA